MLSQQDVTIAIYVLFSSLILVVTLVVYLFSESLTLLSTHSHSSALRPVSARRPRSTSQIIASGLFRFLLLVLGSVLCVSTILFALASWSSLMTTWETILKALNRW